MADANHEQPGTQPDTPGDPDEVAIGKDSGLALTELGREALALLRRSPDD